MMVRQLRGKRSDRAEHAVNENHLRVDRTVGEDRSVSGDARDAEGRSDLREVGAAFGRRLAKVAGLPSRRNLDEVCAGLRGLGFQAAHEGDEIVTPTCPLRPLVAAQPRLAELDEGMWAGLVGGRTTCTAEGCLDPTAPCRIRVLMEYRR